MNINATLIGQSVAFFIFVLFCMKFVWPPVITALRERQKAVESLQQERNDPVKLFNELSAKMPDGLFLTSIKQTDEQVVVQGIAQTNERVSEFLRNLRDSEILAKSPQLDETIVQDVTLSNKNNKSRAYSFKMVLTLKKPEKTEPKKVSTAGAA